jgi:uncharacterized membrane protein YcaP (DUF421 family)
MSMWWNGWSGTGRVVLDAVFVYAAVILVLRVTGKRTLAKLNAFDFVVTVALGSVLAAVITAEDVPLANGIVAIALLAALQYLVALVSSRWPRLHHVVTSEPVVLVRDGKVVHDAARDNRISPDELAAAVRKRGVSDFRDVSALVLETDGTFSLLQRAPTADVLRGVRRAER